MWRGATSIIFMGLRLGLVFGIGWVAYDFASTEYEAVAGMFEDVSRAFRR